MAYRLMTRLPVAVSEHRYMALYMAPASSTQLGHIFLCNTLETTVAHCDYPSLIAHMKVCTSRHRSVRPFGNWNHTWKCQVTSLIWPTSQQHIALWSIKHGHRDSIVSAHSNQSHMPCGYADSQLTSTVSTHTLKMLPSPGIRRIIGRRCRCAACHAPRPEKRIWCVSNGKWRWVILTLLAIMIFLLGTATQPGEGDGKNVSVHTNAEDGIWC